jgi:hypothetical protein
VNPEQPAVGVVAEYERIEEHLTTIEHYLLARALGIGASNDAAKKEEQMD